MTGQPAGSLLAAAAAEPTLLLLLLRLGASALWRSLARR